MTTFNELKKLTKEELCDLVIKTEEKFADSNVAAAELVVQLEETNKELKDSQAQLIQSAKLASLGTMSAGVAHELNNPLTAVKGFTQLISRKDYIQPGELDLLRKIVKATERMQRIINHLRTFSRCNHAKEWNNVNIQGIISDALDLIGMFLKKENIDCSVLVRGNATIEGDFNKLESVFHNLMSNSKDAFESIADDREKSITISLSNDSESRLVVVYKDNAGGMPADVVEKLFDPFFTTKDVGKGTGLGMSICKSIIEEHKGSIAIETEEGRGSTFTIVFPTVVNNVFKSDPTQDERTKKIDYSSNSDFKDKILVIDDEMSLCQFLEACLKDRFNVVTTTDPRSGLEIFNSQHFDLVVTDINMPKISGLEVIRHIRSIDPKIPILVISAHAKLGAELNKAFELGADDFLPKPFDDIDEVFAIVLKNLRK